MIVPVPGPGTDMLGVLMVGRRLDGRVVRSVDLPFLEPLGVAAGLGHRSADGTLLGQKGGTGKTSLAVIDTPARTEAAALEAARRAKPTRDVCETEN